MRRPERTGAPAPDDDMLNLRLAPLGIRTFFRVQASEGRERRPGRVHWAGMGDELPHSPPASTYSRLAEHKGRRLLLES